MTNLLPPAAKKQIAFEYWTRVLCAWVALWSVCMLVGVILLWPTYVLLTGNNAVYAESASEATERVGEFESMSKTLTASSKQAETIVGLSKQEPLTLILDDVWEVVEAHRVEISGVQISREKDVLQPFSISGQADDRQALAQFRDALEALPFVSSVNLPIENLAQNQDISFSLVVKVQNSDV